MDDKDLRIQELKAENKKLREELTQRKKLQDAEPTDMDKLTTEMMEHICDNLCKHPNRVELTQEELDDICAECKMDKFVCDILNTYNRLNDFDKTQSCDLLKKLSAYRNLEEQGLLLKLPCKIGDTVYYIFDRKVKPAIVTHYSLYEYLYITYKGVYSGVEVTLCQTQIGKIVFLTEQEAQSALENMKG